jgi:hypothetical protein
VTHEDELARNRQEKIDALLKALVLSGHMIEQARWWQGVRGTCLALSALTVCVLIGFAFARLPWWTYVAVFVLGFFHFALYTYAKSNLRQMSILLEKLSVYAK